LVEAKVDTDPRLYGGVEGPQIDIIGGHEHDGRKGYNHRLRMEVVDSAAGRTKTFWIHIGNTVMWEIRQTGKPNPVVSVTALDQDFVIVKFDYSAYWSWIGTPEAANLMVYESVALPPVQTVLEDPPLLFTVMIRNELSEWLPLFLSEPIGVDPTTPKSWIIPPALITARDSLIATGPTDVKIVVSGGYDSSTREYVLDRVKRNATWQPLWWLSGTLEGKFISTVFLSAVGPSPAVQVSYRSFILWESSPSASSHRVHNLPATTISTPRPRGRTVSGGAGVRV
jgi:hypothetical protein